MGTKEATELDDIMFRLNQLIISKVSYGVITVLRDIDSNIMYTIESCDISRKNIGIKQYKPIFDSKEDYKLVSIGNNIDKRLNNNVITRYNDRIILKNSR